VVVALPCLFVLYDVPSIGYNEDPQRYWRPAVSLLHHGWKPIAPLWLMTALVLREWLGSRVHASVPVRWVGRAAAAVGCVVLVACLGRWASAAIDEQHHTTRQLVWPASVFQRQARPENCGPAALAAVCRHYGIAATEVELAALAGTTAEGTSMWGLQQAARHKGLVADGWKLRVGELPRVPKPCILYFHAGHFAVLMGVSARSYFLADPSLGQIVVPRSWIEKRWSGELMVVGPGEAPLPMKERS
jgi:hypothetical protein